MSLDLIAFSALDPGSQAEWVGAVGTTLAFAVAAAAFWVEVVRRRRTSRDERTGAFIHWDPDSNDLIVLNLGRFPVRDPTVAVVRKRRPRKWHLRVIPGRAGSKPPFAFEHPNTALMPEERLIERIGMGVRGTAIDYYVSFTSMDGRRWQRGADGKLRRSRDKRSGPLMIGPSKADLEALTPRRPAPPE